MFSVDVFTMRRVKIMKVFALWKQDDRMPARFCVCVSARVCVYVWDKERDENDTLLGDKKQTGKRDGRKRLISPRIASKYRGAKNIGHLKLYQKAAI